MHPDLFSRKSDSIFWGTTPKLPADGGPQVGEGRTPEDGNIRRKDESGPAGGAAGQSGSWGKLGERLVKLLDHSENSSLDHAAPGRGAKARAHADAAKDGAILSAVNAAIDLATSREARRQADHEQAAAIERAFDYLDRHEARRQRLGKTASVAGKTVTERIKATFDRAAQKLRSFVKKDADPGNLIEDAEKYHLNNAFSAINAGRTVATLVSIPQAGVPDVGGVGFGVAVAALPSTLYYAVSAASEGIDDRSNKITARRTLEQHREGAKRFIASQKPDASAPATAQDAESYSKFCAAMKTVPALYEPARMKFLASQCAVINMGVVSVARNAIDMANGVGLWFHLFASTVLGSLTMASGALSIAGGALDIVEGQSALKMAAESKKELREKQLAFGRQMDKCKEELSSGMNKLMSPIGASIQAHFARREELLEIDQATAKSKTSRGIAMVIGGAALVTIGVCSVAGLMVPPIGIVLGVTVSLLTIVYLQHLRKKAGAKHEYTKLTKGEQIDAAKGLITEESAESQELAARKVKGQSLKELTSIYYESAQRIQNADAGVDQPTVSIDREMAGNIYFSLHYMATVLASKYIREGAARDTQRDAALSQSGSAAQSSERGRSAVFEDARSMENAGESGSAHVSAGDPAPGSLPAGAGDSAAAHDGRIARESRAEQCLFDERQEELLREKMLEDTLRSLGMTERDLACLRYLGQDDAPGDNDEHLAARVAKIKTVLAPVLEITIHKLASTEKEKEQAVLLAEPDQLVALEKTLGQSEASGPGTTSGSVDIFESEDLYWSRP
jgi:hypothetical protein